MDLVPLVCHGMNPTPDTTWVNSAIPSYSTATLAGQRILVFPQSGPAQPN